MNEEPKGFDVTVQGTKDKELFYTAQQGNVY
jgi:hypothetical protein